MTFIVDFKDQMRNHEHVIRDHERIAHRYFHGSMMVDLFTLIPVQWLRLDRNRERYFYLIKLIRLKQGL
jgi:hypothetical protein